MEGIRFENEVWISFIDGGRVVEGFFVLIEETQQYVKIKSGSNILTIPYHKINKIKKRGGE